MLVSVMKNEQKKIPRNFRLNASIDAELRRQSQVTGISETQIIEDALQEFLSAGNRRKLEAAIKKLKMERAKGFEPSTLTLAT
jgi:hypothetical protein